MEILKKKGSLIDIELYDAAKDIQEIIGFREFNKTLMRMEIQGKIIVSTARKGKRRVEIVTQTKH